MISRHREYQQRIAELEGQIAAFTNTKLPHEFRTLKEKQAYAFGWWKALEVQRRTAPENFQALNHPQIDVEGVPI